MTAKDEESNVTAAYPYKRVMLKMSGEVLMGPKEFGLDSETVERVAQDIKEVVDLGIEVCVVVGAGNIFRGVSGAADGMDRTTADYMGMLGIVINALALQNSLENMDVDTRVQSAIRMDSICEPYIRRKAMRHMAKGRVVIFAAGTGNPYFTTDTAATLRASEMDCDVIMKATKVDGVYSADPKKDPSAVHFDRISYLDVLTKDLKVMDATAISLARENNIPIVVFSVLEEGNFAKAAKSEGKFTIVTNTQHIEIEVKMALDKNDIKRRMDGAIDTLHKEFSGLRTGRASANLLDPVVVDLYGSKMPLNQVGTISVPEPRMLSVQVWDASAVRSVEKAIRDAGLGLNPMPDGNNIRIPIPDLNEERRQELVKVAGKYAESARIAVRNVRRDGMDDIKKMEKDNEVTEDDAKRLSDDVQKLTDDSVKKIDSMLSDKEKDIMTV